MPTQYNFLIKMRLESDVKLDFKDVLFRPKRSTLSSRQSVCLERTYTFLHSKKVWTGVPIVASNMDKTGTFSMAQELQKHKMLTCVHKHYTLEDWEKAINTLDPEYFAISSGISASDLKFVDTLLTTYPQIQFICLDVANGYQESFVDKVKETRERHPSKTIVAGNVVTGEMVEELLLAGADIVKVGIGSGSACTTRKQTGVGYPQLSAVIECADAAHGLGGCIMSDGGCVVPGDVAKAFGGGADFCMIGGMLAGHTESEGDIRYKDGKEYMEFYGMSSDTAMCKYKGSVAEYRSSEGKTVLVPYRGPVNHTIMDMLGGIRSTCTYVGAKTLKELSKRTTFVRVTQQLNNCFS